MSPTIALLAVASAALGADPVAPRAGPGELFAEANALYRQAAGAEGDARRALYEASAERYARIASRVPNAYVLYNLGNAYYRAGRSGRAIAAYRRAELLMPRHGALRRNLALARDGAPGGATAPRPHPAAAAFFFWHFALSTAEVEALAAAAFVLCMGALGARLFVTGGPRRRLRSAAIALGVASSVLVVSSLAKLSSSDRDDAVVVEEQASVRSEPAGRAVELHVLREGAEVRVAKRAGDWTRIESGAGTRGWVETRALEVLADPPAVIDAPAGAAAPAAASRT